MNTSPEEVGVDTASATVTEVSAKIMTWPETSVYSNLVALAIGENDFRFNFGEALPDGRSFSRIAVILPPEQAAVLGVMLVRHMRLYEERFGKLRSEVWQSMKGQIVEDSPKETGG